jgi:hypothetical protein
VHTGDRLIADHGALRAIIEIAADHLMVLVWDKSGNDPIVRMVAQEEHRPVDDVDGAKEKAVFIIAGECGHYTKEQFETVRRDLNWRRADPRVSD